MEAFNIRNLSFKYSGASGFALSNVNLKVNEGEFVLLIGESGCGKTTLLKMLKKELSPYGEAEGEIFYKGNKIDSLTKRESAEKVGFVMQEPDAQIVTDKVYSELAFGLENLGFENEVIRAKVSEFATYFGLSDKFNSKTNTLSGGQKQLLNLASVMAVNPEVLILDEPTSQLDPISALEFLNTVRRLNEDLGTTVIIAEHHLNEIFSLADKVAYMENGTITAFDTPKRICFELKNKRIAKTLPVPVRVHNRLGLDGEYPLNVKEGRRELLPFANDKQISFPELKSESVISCRDIWFRYEKRGKDILKNCSFSVGKGEIYALAGENGSGKSTVLNVISGALKPYRGKVKLGAKTALLPQSPKRLFVKDTVKEDFEMIDNSYKELSDLFNISHLLERHPYDLSGGELQRAAICKLMLTKPEILLLDEPTKGLDSFAKEELGLFLKKLCEKGATILLVTHDLEFAAQFADRCGLLFDGLVTSENFTNPFFTDNNFYTTAAARMTKNIFKNAVTVDDIVELIK